MDYDSCIKEIFQIYSESCRVDVSRACLQQILELTGDINAIRTIISYKKLMLALVSLLRSSNDFECQKTTCLILMNLTTEVEGVLTLLKADCVTDKEGSDNVTISPQTSESGDDVVKIFCNFVEDKDSALADPSCMILCNLSRDPEPAEIVASRISEPALDRLVAAFCDLKYNRAGCNLRYLGPFFSNLSQVPKTQRSLIRKLEVLLPFTEYQFCSIRRGGIVGMLKNMSFISANHDQLLLADNVLPRILLPLAGPEEFSDDEMDKLPIELQYLPNTKIREEDPDIRTMLLEILLQFCTTSKSRNFLREYNTYIILRELHKNEKDSAVLLACENVVDILISKPSVWRPLPKRTTSTEDNVLRRTLVIPLQAEDEPLQEGIHYIHKLKKFGHQLGIYKMGDLVYEVQCILEREMVEQKSNQIDRLLQEYFSEINLRR